MSVASNWKMPTAASLKQKKPGTFGGAVFTPAAKKVTPAALAAPTAAPTAPSAPKFDINNLPVDPVFDQSVGALGRTRDDTIAGLEGQKTSTLADYGYSATYNPDGSVASLTVDPNNPFSRAAQLKKSYDQAKTGTGNSLAAQGQLYSGALANAQNANDTGYSQGQNTLEKSLGSILAGIIGGERTARSDFETGKGTAFGDRVTRAGSNPLYSPTAADAPAAPAAPATSNIDLSKWIQSEYKSPSGLPARRFGDGHREVFQNGQWKRV
jgi:hypothetical protein